MSRTIILLTAAASTLAACASWRESELEASWKAEWNARADTAVTRWDNPCGDPQFDPWAHAFIANCEPEERISHAECERRERWLGQRLEQCGEWQAYLLRNHGKHARDASAAEPPTRVE